jgi:hypothetical protein
MGLSFGRHWKRVISNGSAGTKMDEKKSSYYPGEMYRMRDARQQQGVTLVK